MKETHSDDPLVFTGSDANRISDNEVRSGYFLNKMTQNPALLLRGVLGLSFPYLNGYNRDSCKPHPEVVRRIWHSNQTNYLIK